MGSKGKRIKKPSKIFLMHYWKLIYRSLLFLAAVGLYIINRVKHPGTMFIEMDHLHIVLVIIWIVYAVEMLLRFIPSDFESMGCQKQFKKNYMPTNREPSQVKLTSKGRVLAVLAAWIGLNGLIGILYYTGVIDAGILVLISLAYSVCDMICILFFCPFQTWFMKNRCCTTCRIYNWDFPMMFTPFIFIPSVYTWSLLAMAILLVIRWEVTVHKHPEYFSEVTNKNLSCAQCQEKLCHYKKQLRTFIR